MEAKDKIKEYTIRNIINYRKLDWSISDDFLYLTDVPEIFEPFEMKPHYFAYGIINSGSIMIEVDYQNFLVDKRSLLIYRPEQNVKVITIEAGTKGMFVLFTKKFMDYLFESFFSIAPNSFLKNKFGSQVVLTEEDHSKMNTLFTRTLDFLIVSEADNERWIYSAKSILLALINESDFLVNRYIENRNSIHQPREEQIGYDFKKLVSKHYLTFRNIEFYAQELNITTNYLHKIVKSQFHQTPSEIINMALLSECKVRLSDPRDSISQIADHLEFTNIQSFSRYFKKQTGETPISFRTHHNLINP
ncbi:helix-turn-helix transcriptional regulator [Pedobacter sp. MC2016-05]|uniref:helix-turn-helix domain-containing protein n=1 Tax=Pedobacter sp. MC2016-05 TaxID=2994474 RepID=UPI002247D8F3|nr:helix-turn-helix transcriptional regulator [Pedobacter sp. MC2016-05]MCX2475292.1 helix-turn-helix transcriptional regulator [Pedobacter sp. MC2016-05]